MNFDRIINIKNNFFLTIYNKSLLYWVRVLKILIFIVSFVLLASLLSYELLNFIKNKQTGHFINVVIKAQGIPKTDDRIKLLNEEFRNSYFNNKAFIGFHLANLYLTSDQEREAVKILINIYNARFINQDLRYIALSRYSDILLSHNEEENYKEVAFITDKIQLKKNNNFTLKIVMNNIIANKLIGKSELALKKLEKLKKNSNLEIINQEQLEILEKFVKE